MCQAYEAERAGIVSSENRWTIMGFKAFFTGEKPPMYYRANSGRHDYESRAWDHGYACAKEGLLPYAVEQDLFKLPSYQVQRWTCPTCHLKVGKYASNHKFGIPCDGSNPYDQLESFVHVASAM